MFLMLAMFAAAQLSGPLPDGFERITPQVAAERVGNCGTGTVTIRSDPNLDTDVLVVAGKGTITDEQIACIAKAASFYEVELPPDAQPRLNAITEARGAAIVEAYTHNWLATHNLLGRLPKYEAGVTNDAAFAREIEKLCKAKGALQSQYGVHALNPAWATRQKDEPLEDQPFACVINVALASGFKLGFIGNEQFAPR